VEVFREPLKRGLQKQLIFPGKEKFVGVTPDAEARYQLLSFLTMYDLYYSNKGDARERLAELISTPLPKHRKAIFEAPRNRKRAVKDFRKMVRGEQLGAIGTTTVQQLAIAVGLAAGAYTNPASAVSLTPQALLHEIVNQLPAAAASQIQVDWKTAMNSVIDIFTKKPKTIAPATMTPAVPAVQATSTNAP
jgi:hypothetical protein